MPPDSLPEPAPSMQGHALRPLTDWPIHAWTTVQQLASSNTASPSQQALVLRLAEIGCVPGQKVCVVARGMPGGDPLAVRIGRSTFALRRSEAVLVLVEAANTPSLEAKATTHE